jgi:hypothetical protein
MVTYRAEQIDWGRWRVLRVDLSRTQPTTIGVGMTKAEATVCANALNKHAKVKP